MFDPQVGKIPLEKEMATHPSVLAWRILRDRGAWRATARGVEKSRTRQSDVLFLPYTCLCLLNRKSALLEPLLQNSKSRHPPPSSLSSTSI